MIAVIFEFAVNESRGDDYFELATALRAQLDTVDGFLGIERFESLATPGKFVSISLWRDERAISRWRAATDHRAAQEQGKAGIFAEFTLRVAEIKREIRFSAGTREEISYSPAMG